MSFCALLRHSSPSFGLKGRYPAAFIVFFVLVFSGCRDKKSASESSVTIAEDSSGVVVQHARGVQISRLGTSHVVSLLESSSDTTRARFVLVPDGQKVPEGFRNDQVISIPVKSFAALSGTHIGFLEALSADGLITGVGRLSSVFSEKVRNRIRSGSAVELGEQQGISAEKLALFDSGVIMVSAGAGTDVFKPARDRGIPVLPVADWLEETPLGRAEWIKFFGLLAGKEKQAEQLFSEVEARYRKLAEQALSQNPKPVVLSGLPYKDVWYVPGGKSYMAHFFRDAGMAYPWQDEPTVSSLPLGFEAVYAKALNADVWVNLGADQLKSREDVKAVDKRYADFKPWKSNRVFGYSRKVNSDGANDFWESAIANPDKVLADLIKIAYPDLLPTHELVYYEQLP